MARLAPQTWHGWFEGSESPRGRIRDGRTCMVERLVSIGFLVVGMGAVAVAAWFFATGLGYVEGL